MSSAPYVSMDQEAQKAESKPQVQNLDIEKDNKPQNKVIECNVPNELDLQANGKPSLNECSLRASIVPDFHWKTFIFWCTIANVVVTVVTTIMEALWENADTRGAFGTCLSFEIGAFFTPAVINYYHFHRFIMPMLLHSNWISCVTNMFIQVIFGFEQENFFGTKKYIFMYLLTGIASNLFAGIYTPEAILVGSQSALYGLSGIQMAYLKERWGTVNKGRRVIIFVVCLVLIQGFTKMWEINYRVGHWAHLGGMVIGFYVGLMFLTKSVGVRRFAIGLTTIVFIFGFVVFYQTPKREDFAEYISTLCHNLVYNSGTY